MRFSNMVGLAFAALGLIGLLVLYRAGPPPPASTGEEAAAAAGPAAPTTVILVRHAEKADDGTDDPPLTGAGRARARALADVLAGSGVDAVIATPFRRTRATATPAAERFDAPVSVVGVEDGVEAHAEAVARRIVEQHAGRSVLVVGHSNTIPAIVAALGGEIPPVAEHEYDRLVIMVLSGHRPPRVVRARYGGPVGAHMGGGD